MKDVIDAFAIPIVIVGFLLVAMVADRWSAATWPECVCEEQP